MAAGAEGTGFRANATDVFDFDILNLQVETPIYTLILTLIVLYFLNRWLFKPVLRTLDNRASMMKALQDRTKAHEEETATLRKDYEQRLEQVRAEVSQVRAEAARGTQQAVNEIMSKAREEAHTELEGALRDLRQESENARKSLEAEAQKLADLAGQRLLPS